MRSKAWDVINTDRRASSSAQTKQNNNNNNSLNNMICREHHCTIQPCENVRTTHIIMEGLCFTGVVTCLPPLWSSTIQVPEYTVDKTGHEARTGNHTTWTHLWDRREHNTAYHHQECRNPGGSPSVMFFSHRILGEQDFHSEHILLAPS